MSRFRITDGKGFAISFANGWGVSVQFGYGNYADNYNGEGVDSGGDYRERNRRLGELGSGTAECAVFDSNGEMIKQLPAFMFDDSDDFRDMVSNRSTPAQVLQLMNWTAAQERLPGEPT